MAITQPSPPNRFGGAALASQSWKWLMEPFGHAPQVGLVFGEESPQSPKSKREICGPVRLYRIVLLTMIKIVLIAGISFAPPCQ
jgi:hypothetical protein